MTEQGPAGQWQVTCQCGWRTHGSKETVVPAVQEHGRSAHAQEISEAEVMKLAVPMSSPAGQP